MWQWCISLSVGLLGGGLSELPSRCVPQARPKPFLIGAEWREDASPAVKDLFWETGCNFARVTGGGYAWAVDAHRRALAELNAHGVRTLIQLGSHYPDSRFFEFKDAYFVDQNGKTGVPSKKSWAVEYDDQSWPQYSYASTHFRTELEKDFTSYLKAIGPLDGVEAIMLHNEAGLLWLDKRIFDYNPESISRFRHWLPSQHQSISQLNSAWGSSFESFDNVEPPHEVPTSDTLASWMDWRRSNIEVIGDFLRWERELARRVEPGLPATTNLSGPIDNWFPYRLGDNYRFTKDMDIASIDIYPGSEWTGQFFPGYSMDMTRGAANGKPVYVAECESYAAARFPKLSDPQRADRLSSDLWTYIGHGANAILVWTLNGQDEFRLTNGEFNARMGVLRETAHVAKMLNLGEFSKPARSVALVIDQDSYLLIGNGPNPRSWAGESDKNALGLYGALAQAHIETDVISIDMVRSGAGNRYKALVLASPKAMDPLLAQRLTTYVQAGGLLLADASLASVNRWGKTYPTHPSLGLDRLFGVKVTSGDDRSQFTVQVANHSFKGQGRSKITLQDAESLAQFPDGGVAVAQHAVGKGHAIMLATSAGPLNSTGNELGFSQTLGDWLRRYAGVSPSIDIQNPGGYLDVNRLADAKGNSIIVVTNPPNQAEPASSERNVRVSLPNVPASIPSYLFEPPNMSNGRTLAGPRPIHGGSWVIPNLTSHATILTAPDHSPLLSTDSPSSIETGSRTTFGVTVYNPSPRAIVGSLRLSAGTGWRSGSNLKVNLAPYGQTTVKLTALSGPQTKRIALKAIFDANNIHVESVPFDVEVIDRR